MWLTHVLEILFPLSERVERTHTYTELPVRIQHTHIKGFSLTTLLSYEDQMVRDVIQSAKFERDERALLLLSSVLDEFLTEFLSDHTLNYRGRLVITIVPLGKKRLQERGYNQVDLMVRKTRAVCSGILDYQPHLVRRIRDTKPQTTLTRTERQQNVAGAFSCEQKLPKGTHLLIIDDVLTTGATISEVACACRSNPDIEVSLLTLARA